MGLILRDELIGMIRARCDVNPPATVGAIASAEAALGVTFDPYLRYLFIAFDGFDDFYTGSLIRFWSLEEIVRERGEMYLKFDAKYHAVGDFLISSHYVFFCLENANVPVLYDWDEAYSPDVDQFLRDLVRGKFDF